MAPAQDAPPPPPSVLGRALRGSSYLFLQKIFTFAVNSFILRRLHLSVTGAVTVQFELALATVFLFRDSFRLAFLRMPSLVDAPPSSESSPTERKHRLVNVAWVSTIISWILGALIMVTMTVCGSGESQKGLEGYTRSLVMYCAAAMIEAVAEPMYLLAHSSVLVGWQVSAQGTAFVVRALVQYVGIFVFQLEGLLCYGLAELAYALTLLSVFAWFFYWKLRENKIKDVKGMQSMTELLPSLHRGSISTHTLFDPEILAILTPLGIQSVVKYLLTEGDKWVLSLFTTLQQMGVYGIVFHLGSLVPRIVFFPLEEATKTVISKLNKEDAGDVARAKRFVLVLLKLMHLIGLVFLCFGTNYAYTLIMILYGVDKARGGVGPSLAAYCAYIPFLGLNGICEAFVHAVGDKYELMRLNQLMGIFFIVYAISSMVFMWGLDLGTIGIICANCVNMSCRIFYCITFIASYFRNQEESTTNTTVGPSIVSTTFSFWRQALPDRLVLIAFGVSFVVGAVSQQVVLINGSWFRHGIHVLIGGASFATVLAALYVREQKLVREDLRQLRSSERAPKPVDDKKSQ